jgi:hypothetical protein
MSISNKSLNQALQLGHAQLRPFVDFFEKIQIFTPKLPHIDSGDKNVKEIRGMQLSPNQIR